MASEEKIAKRRKTRRLLWSWGNYIQRIKRLQEEQKNAESLIDDARITLHAQNLNGMPRGGKSSDLSDVVQNVIELEGRYVELVKRIKEEICETIRLRDAVQELVCQLSPIQEKIIDYRYVDGHTWNYIVFKTQMCESYLKRIESEAVDFIAERIE